MLKVILKYNSPYDTTPCHDIPKTSWGVAFGRTDEKPMGLVTS